MKTWFQILEKLVKDNERRAWIKRAWVEWRRCRTGTSTSGLMHRLSKGEHTWLCARATIALALDLEVKAISANEQYEWGECVASAYQGHYQTDFGLGVAFEELRVKGFRYLIQSDGTL